MAPKFCSKCGAPLTDDMLVCPKCGVQLKQAPQVIASAPVEEKEKKEKKKLTKKQLIVRIAIAAGVLVVTVPAIIFGSMAIKDAVDADKICSIQDGTGCANITWQTKMSVVNVPETYKGKKVTRFGFYTDEYCKTLSLPKTIEIIGYDGGHNMYLEELKNLYFGGTLEEWNSIQFNDNLISKSTNFYVASKSGNVIYRFKTYKKVEFSYSNGGTFQY